MKIAEIAVRAFAAASCMFGLVLAAVAVRDPAWGRSGDVAEPYAVMVFTIGAAAIAVGGVVFAVVLMRKP